MVLRRGETETDAQREHHVTTNAAVSQELPRIASHHQKLERGEEGVCLESQREQSPADTLTLEF